MARLGVALGGGMSPPDMVDCVKLAEDLGYESAWVTEGHGGDQFSILTACALATKKILLGTAISSIYVRSAPTIAMAAACVDHFSNNRFILGLGSSHKVQVEGDHGIPYSRPMDHLKDSMEIIRTLLRERTVSYSGDTVDIKGFDLWFHPSRKEIPIYLAAVFPPMLQVCCELAQGIILVWRTLESAGKAAADVADGARRVKRAPEEIDLTCMVPCNVATNGDDPREPIRGAIAWYAGFFPRYNRLMAESGFGEDADAIRQAWLSGGPEKARPLVSDRMIDALAVVGTAEECRRKVENYRDRGIALPIITPARGGDNVREATMDIIRACAPET